VSAGSERTEPATPKRLERARALGDAARSTLASFAAIAWLVALPLAATPWLAHWWAIFLSRSSEEAASAARTSSMDPILLVMRGLGSLLVPAAAIASSWCCAFVASLTPAAACGGLAWSPGALRWRADRLSPAAGFRSLFSSDLLAQTLLGAAASTVILSCAVPATQTLIREIRAAGSPEGTAELALAVTRAFWSRAAIAVTILAVIDVVLARRRHAARLRMTPREVREERADLEGKPEHKARRRAIGMRRVRRLRVAALKRAAAVIANPTHVAVALRYSPPLVDVPTVIAVGAGPGAAIVRTAAAFYDVPVIESPELARMLFARVEVDEPIPEELFAAIAAVFAWILRTRGRLGPPVEDA